MAIVDTIGTIGIYYLGKLSLDPIITGALISFAIVLNKLTIMWINYNYQLPTEPTPENNVRKAVDLLTENIPKVEKLPIE